MLNSVRLQGFKGHRDTTLNLGPLTLLVGDHGSGKSSALLALEWLSGADGQRSDGGHQPSQGLLRKGSEQVRVTATGQTGAVPWRLTRSASDNDGVWYERLESEVGGQPIEPQSGHSPDDGTPQELGPVTRRSLVQETFGSARRYSLRASSIAAAGYSADPSVQVGPDGSNTAVVLAGMKLDDDRRFTRVETALRRIVPNFEVIRVKRAEVHDRGQAVVGHELFFDFHGASNVPARHASQGTLLALSLLTIVFGPARPNLVLVDDLAHGLHPRAQLELLKLLKQLPSLSDVADLQIVATTYSPHVLDELDPGDVIACALGPDGSVQAKSLAQHPEAVRSAGLLSSGQLWSLDLEQNWVVS